MQSSELLANLNEAQREAVTSIFGPVLVIAGPGTGKTQVLAARIAYILQHPDVQVAPGQILCLTFTESGVQAMRQRLVRMVGQQAAYRVQIHTFHSFCNKIIQDYPDKFPRFSANPRQITDIEKLKLIKSILQDLDSDKSWQLRPAGSSKDMYANKILSAIQLLKREGVDPETLRSFTQQEINLLESSPKLNKKGEPTRDYLQSLKQQTRNLELVEIYKDYQQATESQNLYDYEDMILQVVDQLGQDEELAYEILEKYQFILIDEYQDTNGAQNKILQILGKLDPESEPNIFAVGDDDQAIYRFQGANVENILFFKKEFPTAKLIVLTQNYRSVQPILDLAAGSIQHNTQRLSAIYQELDKHLIAALEYTDTIKPTVIGFKHSDEEIAWVIQKIQDLQKAGESLNDIAIIYRNHSDAVLLRQVLEKIGIPHRLAAGSNLLDEPIVMNILQLLNVVAYNELSRDHDLAQLLLLDFVQKQFALNPNDVFTFLTTARDQSKFGHPAYPIKTYVELALALDTENGVRKFVETVINWQQNFANMPLSEALVTVLIESGLMNKVSMQSNQPQNLEALNTFVRFVRDLTLANAGISLESFLADLRVYREEDIKISFNAPSTQDQAVNLLTAHAAKGLEFKHVFIIKLVEKHWSNKAERNLFKWPANLLGSGSEESFSVEEERRLFFVAITRAKQNLFLTYATVYQDANGETEKQPSVFVSEVGEERIQQTLYEESNGEIKSFWQQMLRPKLKVEMQNNEAEQVYLKNLLTDFRLSASSLNTYLQCPLKFKYDCLLKIPSTPSPEIALGNALHKALEQQFKMLIKGGNVDLEQTQQDFVHALQQQLLTRHDYDLTLTEGKQILENYFAQYAAEMRAPAAVEYNFGHHHIELELPGQEPILLTGKIDKLEWIDQKQNTVRLIDYKTMRPKSENAIKGLTKGTDKSIWWQIVFYSVMAGLDDQFKPAGKFDKYRIEQICIDFLRADSTTGQLRQVEMQVTQEDEQELIQIIADTMKAIRNLDFNGTDEHPLCGECEYCKLASSSASA